eukprot:403350117
MNSDNQYHHKGKSHFYNKEQPNRDHQTSQREYYGNERGRYNDSYRGQPQIGSTQRQIHINFQIYFRGRGSRNDGFYQQNHNAGTHHYHKDASYEKYEDFRRDGQQTYHKTGYNRSQFKHPNNMRQYDECPSSSDDQMQHTYQSQHSQRQQYYYDESDSQGYDHSFEQGYERHPSGYHKNIKGNYHHKNYISDERNDQNYSGKYVSNKEYDKFQHYNQHNAYQGKSKNYSTFHKDQHHHYHDGGDDKRVFNYRNRENYQHFQGRDHQSNTVVSDDKDHTQDSQHSHLEHSKVTNRNDIIQPLLADDLHTSSIHENDNHDSECTLSVVAENDFDAHHNETQDEEFTSTQQLIQLCQEKERNQSGNSSRIVTFKQQEPQKVETSNMSVLLDFNDETTTGGDRSLLSEETQSPYIRKQSKTVDLQTQGFILCELKMNTPGGSLDIKIREFDHLNMYTIVELIYNLGEFKMIEMKEALYIYIEDMIQKAMTQKFQDQIKPFYPQSRIQPTAQQNYQIGIINHPNAQNCTSMAQSQ